MSFSDSTRSTRCVAFGIVGAAVAALDLSYNFMRDALLEQPDAAILMILIPYPSPGTRVLGMAIGFALPAAACWFRDRIPGTPATKALFTVAAAVLVALLVRSQGLSWAHEANLALRRWILGLTAFVIAGATVAALAAAGWARARRRPSPDR